MERLGRWLTANRTLLILIAGLLVSRVSLIFCTEQLWPSLERFYTGTVAMEIADGMAMPLWDYQFSSYEAGWLLAALLCLPFFQLFGFTSFAMGLCGIFLYVIQFVLLYRLLARGVNRRVALFFGLQYLLAPYIFNLNSLFVGFNYFNVVFLYALFLTFYRAVFRDNTVRGVVGGPLLSVFCLGLLGGFSTWVCFAFALIAIPCLVHWWIYYRSRDVRPVGVFLAGFLLGGSPLFFRLAIFADGIKTDILDKIIAQDLSGFMAKFWYFIGFENSYGRSVYSDWLEILGTLLFLSIIFLKKEDLGRMLKGFIGPKAVEQGESGTFWLFWLYPVTFLTVFCLSDFADYRYFAPVFPFVFAGNAFAVDLLLRYRNRILKGIGAGCLGVLLLFGVADSIIIPLYPVAPNLALFRDEAYSYELLGCLVSWRFKEDPRRVMRVVNRLSDDEKRTDLLRGFGFELAFDGNERLIKEYDAFFANTYRHRPEFFKAYTKGFVLGLGHQNFEGTPLSEYYPEVLRNIPRAGVERYLVNKLGLIDKLGPRSRPKCYIGLGFQFSALEEEYGLDADFVTRRIGTEYHDDFMRGIALGKTYSYRL